MQTVFAGRTVRPRSGLGQKWPKLPWLPAAKSTTKQRVKLVPIGDLPMPAPQKGSRSHDVAF
jgi:hypothetical protein